MAHEDEGHYAAKHPDGTAADARVAGALRGAAEGDEISCAACERLSGELAVGMGELGRTADLLELRICECQLGLFGHRGASGAHGKKIAPAKSVDPTLAKEIDDGLVGGRLPCAAVWRIAAGRGVARTEVSAACDAAGVKIKPCQLGAF